MNFSSILLQVLKEEIVLIVILSIVEMLSLKAYIITIDKEKNSIFIEFFEIEASCVI